MNIGETPVLLKYMGQPDILWVNPKDEDEAKGAYLDRLKGQSIEGLDINHFSKMVFTELNLAETGGRLIVFDSKRGFHNPDSIQKP